MKTQHFRIYKIQPKCTWRKIYSCKYLYKERKKAVSFQCMTKSTTNKKKKKKINEKKKKRKRKKKDLKS